MGAAETTVPSKPRIKTPIPLNNHSIFEIIQSIDDIVDNILKLKKILGGILTSNLAQAN